MKKLIIFISFITYSFCSFGQDENNAGKILKGILLSEGDSLPVGYAHIYTTDFKEFATTNEFGEFSIKVSKEDSIVFSAIGYDKIPQLVGYFSEDAERKFYIKRKDYLLKSITIFGDTSRLKGFLEPSRSEYLKQRKKKTFEDEKRYGIPQFNGLAVGGLITSFANLFNDRYQQYKKLDKILKEKQKTVDYEELLQEKLPIEFVIKHSALLTNEVKDFLVFWHPSTYFLQTANEYDLVKELQRTEKAYSQLLKDQSPDSNTVSTIELRKLLEK